MPTIVSGSHQPSKTQHVDSGWAGGGWGALLPALAGLFYLSGAHGALLSGLLMSPLCSFLGSTITWTVWLSFCFGACP